MTEAHEHSSDAMSVSAPEGETGAGKKTLGLERWVLFGYVVAAVAMVWLSRHAISALWYYFEDPNENMVLLVAMAVGFSLSMLLYKHRGVNQLSFEVAEELSKVTWPTRRETSSATVVVIITSIIAAGVLGFFDAIWSALTDLVYKV